MIFAPSREILAIAISGACTRPGRARAARELYHDFFSQDGPRSAARRFVNGHFDGHRPALVSIRALEAPITCRMLSRRRTAQVLGLRAVSARWIL